MSLVGGGLPAQSAGLRLTLNESSAWADCRWSAIGTGTWSLAEVEGLLWSVRAAVECRGVTYGLAASFAETGFQGGLVEDTGAAHLVGGSLPAQTAGCEVVSEESRLRVKKG